MTQVAQKGSGAPREGWFFPIMAVAMAATVMAGFALNMSIRHLQFASLPVWVHVHAAVFGGWLLFFILQTGLVRAGSITLHRRLGWGGAVLGGAIVVLGFATVAAALRRGAVPFFFTDSVFLTMNLLEIIVFAGLITAGVLMRRRGDWRKRLMLCGTIMLTAAGVGRLAPLPLLGLWAPAGILGGLLVFIAAGMIFDLITRRGVHPAYYWGAAALSLAQLLCLPISFSAPALWLVAQITRG